MTPSVAEPQPSFSMPPYSRKTIRVNDALPERDVSTHASAYRPIIAERATYWNERGAGTDTIGGYSD